MYTPIQQDAIDNKIHAFMARKSPSWTFSKSVAERFSPALRARRKSSTEIAYEQLEWHHNGASGRSIWQKAH
jgi:hypothetical protein